MSIHFLGSVEQRQEKRNNIWTPVTCDQQHPPAYGRNIKLAGVTAAGFPLCHAPPWGAKCALPQLQDRAGGRCYKCMSLSLTPPPTRLWGAELRIWEQGTSQGHEANRDISLKSKSLPAVSPMQWLLTGSITSNMALPVPPPCPAH